MTAPSSGERKPMFMLAPGCPACDVERAKRWIAELQAFVADVQPQEPHVCPRCKGSGKIGVTSFIDPSKEIEKSCPVCRGRGELVAAPDLQPTHATCPRCGGSTCTNPDSKGCSDRCIMRLNDEIAALRTDRNGESERAERAEAELYRETELCRTTIGEHIDTLVADWNRILAQTVVRYTEEIAALRAERDAALGKAGRIAQFVIDRMGGTDDADGWVKRSAKYYADLLQERDAALKDPERYRLARTHGFGVVDWTERAGPFLRYEASADACLDAVLARKATPGKTDSAK